MSVEFFSDQIPDYLSDAQYLLLPEEIRSVDKDVRRVIYRNSVAPKVFAYKEIARGKKEHRIQLAKQPSSPIFSMDFIPEAMDKIEKEYVTVYMMGISKDYFLSMVDIDASRNSELTGAGSKIDTMHLREMTALVTDFRERVWWRGQDIKGGMPTGGIHGKMVGIVNTTGINVFNADGAGHAYMGTAGDGIRGAMEACATLITSKYDPPFDSVMTPWVLAQLAKNMNATTHITDLERIKGYTDNENRQMIGRMLISEHLIKEDDDGSASAWLFSKDVDLTGEDTVQLLESYPIWHYPINTTKLGIQGKVLCMVGVGVPRPLALCFEDAIDVDGVAG